MKQEEVEHRFSVPNSFLAGRKNDYDAACGWINLEDNNGDDNDDVVG